MKVLLVDDSMTIRTVVRRILACLDQVQVMEAENGVEGLELLNQHSFDLVITDWVMPLMCGVEMVAKFRAEGHDETAILMLTSNGTANDLAEAKEAGVNGFVTKPMSPGSLLRKIRDVLGEKQKTDLFVPSLGKAQILEGFLD